VVAEKQKLLGGLYIWTVAYIYIYKQTHNKEANESKKKKERERERWRSFHILRQSFFVFFVCVSFMGIYYLLLWKLKGYHKVKECQRNEVIYYFQNFCKCWQGWRKFRERVSKCIIHYYYTYAIVCLLFWHNMSRRWTDC
jgi:nitrate reductase NapE component